MKKKGNYGCKPTYIQEQLSSFWNQKRGVWRAKQIAKKRAPNPSRFPSSNWRKQIIITLKKQDFLSSGGTFLWVEDYKHDDGLHNANKTTQASANLRLTPSAHVRFNNSSLGQKSQGSGAIRGFRWTAPRRSS